MFTTRLTVTLSANNLDTIPAPLLDRVEALEVSGYVSEEKAVIAQKYLGPQAKDASGLKDADVELDREAVDVLIKYYCRESGVFLPSYLGRLRLWGGRPCQPAFEEAGQVSCPFIP